MAGVAALAPSLLSSAPSGTEVPAQLPAQSIVM
jgi:hypothetical protein